MPTSPQQQQQQQQGQQQGQGAAASAAAMQLATNGSAAAAGGSSGEQPQAQAQPSEQAEQQAGQGPGKADGQGGGEGDGAAAGEESAEEKAARVKAEDQIIKQARAIRKARDIKVGLRARACACGLWAGAGAFLCGLRGSICACKSMRAWALSGLGAWGERAELVTAAAAVPPAHCSLGQRPHAAARPAPPTPQTTQPRPAPAPRPLAPRGAAAAGVAGAQAGAAALGRAAGGDVLAGQGVPEGAGLEDQDCAQVGYGPRIILVFVLPRTLPIKSGWGAGACAATRSSRGAGPGVSGSAEAARVCVQLGVLAVVYLEEK